ncbi:amidase [Aetokthonos hydrillicola Thurmond2011]|jgi:amidase|uniref:Amidase n=1 Tax=Aetokthonos hydrillicola Thurmond2011 TaxID=2712845 RepID=A0AAP5IFW1_9CYAN|nr:amidase [Aetokthonos hydrillicola]MBO3459551.1 amidase [Aetokthonos hydrillicola CCALA 1050]MBW4590300.1 amidase [Aetokthonos hydrillicola CCALA 1050]MDR9899412.1 amidase [Aetokthonos hydrillicola Thurmond2011]
MNQIDLAFKTALEQAELIRRREVSPIELVEIYLNRISTLNPQLGSYFTVTAEQAIADAQAKTEILTTTSELPPFFGVPISIKDLNPVADVPCTYGNPALLNNIPNYDDGVVTQIKQAGFIILGKTATSELGSFPYTEPTGFPAARNPWNLEYTPGGSSGGAAAAVAAGLCAIAQGSDGGGSIRGPAACCGLVGIKPSRGRVSHAPVGDRLSGLATNGPLARTVADAAALLDVISGYVTGDPYWLPDPQPSFLAATQEKPGRLRIAYTTNIPPMGKADKNCEQGVLQTLKFLEELGHTVEEISFDFSGLVEPFTFVWQTGVAASAIPSEALQPLNRWLIAQTGSAGQYLQAVSQLQMISRQIVAIFETVDVLVLPVYLHSPIRVGEWADLSPQETFQKIIHWIAPCPPANATGQPAIALPVGFDEVGLPIGVQLMGRPAAEATLISVAAQLEAANPWINHRPSL